MWARLKTSKVAWTAVSGILTTLGLLAKGEISWQAALVSVATGLVILFGRDTMAGKGPGKHPA